MRNKKLILLFFLLAFSAVGVYSAVQRTITIIMTGTVIAVNVEVYTDLQSKTALYTINWGALEQGEAKTLTYYLKSTSTVDSTLSISTSVWSPSIASSYISLAWNKEGYLIKPDEVIPFTLILTVSPDIKSINSFSFNVVITATQI